MATKKELDRLTSKGTFDWCTARESSDVPAEARASCEKIHIGLVFCIAGENHGELPDGDPFRIIKGRFVFQGNEVRDEIRDYAMFQNLGSFVLNTHLQNFLCYG